MTALYVLLVIVTVCLVISLIPVGVHATYGESGANVVICVGLLKIQLIPKKPKMPKNPKKEKKQRKKKQKAEETDGTEAAEKAEETPKRDIGGMIPLFRELLGLALELLGCVKRKLRMDRLILRLNIGGAGENPAASAMLYGSAWAAIGSLTPVLERIFNIRQRDIQAEINFQQEDNRIYAEAKLTILVGDVFKMGVYYGLRAFGAYRRFKKGGNVNGTSDQ